MSSRNSWAKIRREINSVSHSKICQLSAPYITLIHTTPYEFPFHVNLTFASRQWHQSGRLVTVTWLPNVPPRPRPQLVQWTTLHNIPHAKWIIPLPGMRKHVQSTTQAEPPGTALCQRTDHRPPTSPFPKNVKFPQYPKKATETGYTLPNHNSLSPWRAKTIIPTQRI